MRQLTVLPAHSRGRSFKYLTVAMRFAEEAYERERAQPASVRRVELYVDHPNGTREHATLRQGYADSPRWTWHRSRSDWR